MRRTTHPDKNGSRATAHNPDLHPAGGAPQEKAGPHGEPWELLEGVGGALRPHAGARRTSFGRSGRAVKEGCLGVSSNPEQGAVEAGRLQLEGRGDAVYAGKAESSSGIAILAL